MIAYVTVGADDIEQAKRFYSAFLPALGYNMTQGPEGLSFALPVPDEIRNYRYQWFHVGQYEQISQHLNPLIA